MTKFDCQSFMASVRREAGEQSRTVPPWHTCSALLRLEGNDFLVAAYRTLLKREVDNGGLHGYAARSATLSGRITIFLALLASPEGLLLPAPLRRFIHVCRRCLRWKRGNKT